MRVVIVTPPEPVVTVAEAKAHLKVQHGADDALIAGMIAAATETLDGPNGWLGRALGVQTLETFLPAFGVVSIGLCYPPAIDIIEVNYVDTAGQTQLVDPGAYELVGQMLRPKWGTEWPAPAWRGVGGESVRIRYRAGYQTIPAPIRAAILLMVGDLYRNRETTAAITMSTVPMSTTVENLLGPYRVFF